MLLRSVSFIVRPCYFKAIRDFNTYRAFSHRIRRQNADEVVDDEGLDSPRFVQPFFNHSLTSRTDIDHNHDSSIMLFTAFIMGTIAASSLLAGAVLGLVWKPSQRTTAAVMAFGAGILISALAFELVEDAYVKAGYWPVAIGCLAGGGLFALLNRLLNSKGAFARKQATAKKFVMDRKQREAGEILERLSKVDLLRNLPPQDIDALIPDIETLTFPGGTIVFREGQEPDGLYLIEKGKVQVLRGREVGEDERASVCDDAIAELDQGDAFGEMALLVAEKRTATVRCHGDCVLLRVKREAFDRLAKTSPGLAMAVSKLLAKRLDSISARHVESEKERKRWKEVAEKSVPDEVIEPTVVEMRKAVAASGGAPLAIWLGILMDGIPESAVIGASIGPGKMVGMALMAGIFLSNFPESLSSAVGMKQAGHGRLRIMIMWGSLVLLSGLWAVIGHLICTHTSSEAVIAVFQGIGAGAMLTMVAETMLPEAFEQGGSIVGISTLLGFLSAYFLSGL